MSPERLSEAFFLPATANRAFFHIIWTIEAFNGFAAARVLENPQDEAKLRKNSLGFPVRHKRPFSTHTLLNEFISSDAPYNQRFRWAEAFASLDSEDSDSSISLELVRDVVKTIQLLPGLPTLPACVPLKGSVYFGSMGGRELYSSSKVFDGSKDYGKSVVTFADQLLSPLDVAQGIAERLLSGPRANLRAEILLQRFIRSYFELDYGLELKVLLAAVLEEMNESLFAETGSSLDRRPATIDSQLVVLLIRKALARNSGRNGVTFRRQAVGVALALRWCKIFRVRYYKVERQDGQICSGQCKSPLRRIEYGYFMNRILGSLSEIPGMNFIFRGGILPRSSSGRALVIVGPPGSGKTVLALQKACGIAARGGLAIYVSLEERNELLVDRMIAFGLRSEPGFDFDIVFKIEKFEEMAEKGEKNRGMLLVYGGGKDSNFDLVKLLTGLGGKGPWRWRALVIDSVNALDIIGMNSKERVTPTAQRLAARQLIELIEDKGFLGILLSEDGLSRFVDIEYTADTVLRVSADSGRRTRWLEIAKCRSQNHHRGQHQFRLVEGMGVDITPSLGAIRSALRRRTKGDLSQVASIPFPAWSRGCQSLPEKAASLFFGGRDVVRTELMIALSSEWSRNAEHTPSGAARRRRGSLLLLSFRKSEVRLKRLVRSSERIAGAWDSIETKMIRCFSPGETLTGDQVVWEVWHQIKHARRVGLPIERIVFEDVENMSVALPSVGEERLFLVTIFELLGTEAVTSFWSYDERLHSRVGQHDEFELISSEVDFVFEVGDEIEEESGRSRPAGGKVVPVRLVKGPQSEVTIEPARKLLKVKTD